MALLLLLAHLFGDYILQWDNLSRWKSEQLTGVFVHGGIVLAVTLIFTLPFDPSFWPWAILIGLSHTLIDGLELPIRRRLASQKTGKGAFSLFIIDQVLHLAIIVLVLDLSGYWSTSQILASLVNPADDQRWLTFLVAYAFLTMPAWILIRFLVHGLMNGSTPDFSLTFGSKYVGILERGLIATLILFGQFLLVPLVTLPRLIFEWPQNRHLPGDDPQLIRKNDLLYFTELIISVALAVAIGLALRQLR